MDAGQLTAQPKEGHLSLWIKLIYGSGDWSYASFGTLRQIFYAIFLTDVVGLDARLASFAALGGIIWDAVNDPIVGVISDRVKTRWGRRRPFLLFFSIPFGLSFLLLWWAPPWQNQIALMLTVMLAYMLSDTFQTLVSVPYNTLTPEIAPDYDERTTLTGFRMFFNLLASLTTAVAAPMIVKGTVQAGATLQQGLYHRRRALWRISGYTFSAHLCRHPRASSRSHSGRRSFLPRDAAGCLAQYSFSFCYRHLYAQLDDV